MMCIWYNYFSLLWLTLLCFHLNPFMKGLHLKTRKCLLSLADHWNFSSLWISLWALCRLPLSTSLMIHWLIFLSIHTVLKNINQTLAGCKIQLGKVTSIIPLQSKYCFYMLYIQKRGVFGQWQFSFVFSFQKYVTLFYIHMPLLHILQTLIYTDLNY